VQHVSIPCIPAWEVTGVLGRGGFGTVFSAIRQKDGLKAALKVARVDRPGTNARLNKEIRALSTIGPPNVPQLYDSGQTADGAAFAVLELVEAPTLAQMVGSKSMMTLPEFVPISLAILDAVEAAHVRGIVHRDLKPENIFIEGLEPKARLIDFGLVRFMSQRHGATEISTTNETIIGTADYMSPEQCQNSGAIGKAADIYSLGIIFFELLSGRVPFFGKPADVREAHRSKRPPRLSEFIELSSAMEEVVLRCLAKEPKRRFPTIASLRTALQIAASGERPERPADDAKLPAVCSPAPSREKRTMGLVFFESGEDAASVQALLTSFGGQLAHAAVNAYAGAFSHDSGDNPAKRAFLAGRAIIERALATRVLIDVAPVIVQAKLEGGCRYLSPLFFRQERYLSSSHPRGIFLTEASAKLLEDIPTAPAASQSGVLRVLSTEPAAEEHLTLADPEVVSLIGREDVLESLLDSARQAVNGGGATIATVIAEAGHGKSRLASALIHRLAKEANTHLLQFRPREPIGGDLDQTLRELLIRVLRISYHERPADGGRSLLRQRLGAQLAGEVWAGVALVLGWVSADAAEVRSLAAAPGALRAVVARAAGETIRRWALAKPLLFVLDDAQFADDATLDAIEYATLAENQVPIWACVLARPAFRAGRPNWGARCAEHHLTQLGPLSLEAGSELCRTLLSPAENVPAEAVQRLVNRTHAIPLLLVELVRALKSEGLVRQNARTGTWYLATDELERLPEIPIVDWIAARELESLPPDLASHARLAATLGAEFSVEEIFGVLKELERDGAAQAFPLDAVVAINRLVAAGILLRGGHGQLNFRHELVREAVYKSVPRSVGRTIHVAAARFYRDTYPLPEGNRLARLAFHAARSGLQDVALETFLTLAHHAQARHAYLEAELMYTRALEQMGQNVEAKRLGAHRGRGLMRYRLGRFEDACKDFDIARQLADVLGDAVAHVEILLDEANALDWNDEYRRSKDLVDQAHQRSTEMHSPLVEARLLMGRGVSCFRFNQDAQAAELLDRAAKWAEPLGDAGYETYVISLLLNGYVLATLGRLNDSEEAFARVIPLCTERGDKLYAAGAMLNRLMLWTCRNDKARLLEDHRRVLALSRELGNGRLEQQAHYYVGLFLRWLNELDEAERHARRAVEIDMRRFGDAARPESELLLGRVLAARGDFDGARGILDQIRARQARARAKGEREVELLPSEAVFFSMIKLLTSEPHDAEWSVVQERAKACLTGQDLIEFWEMRGRTARRLQQEDVARKAFEEALAIAARIPSVMRERLEHELHGIQATVP